MPSSSLANAPKLVSWVMVPRTTMLVLETALPIKFAATIVEAVGCEGRSEGRGRQRRTAVDGSRADVALLAGRSSP